MDSGLRAFRRAFGIGRYFYGTACGGTDAKVCGNDPHGEEDTAV